MVDDALEHRDARRALEQLFHAGKLRTAHGAQHAARELEARELLEQLRRARIDGNVPAALDEHALWLDMTALHEQRQR